MNKLPFLLLLLLSLQLVSCSSSSEPAEGTIAKDVSADQFKELIDSGKGILVDVRTPSEYNSGHIGDAVNIDYNSPQFSEAISELDKNQPVYVYCAAGGRSAGAMAKLNEMGFVEVYNLIGGYNGWSK